jgi:hypothetical protein
MKKKSLIFSGSRLPVAACRSESATHDLSNFAMEVLR